MSASDSKYNQDWNAMASQFMGAFAQAAQQAQTGAGAGFPSGMDAWSKLFTPKAGGQEEIAQRMLDSSKQFLAMVQNAAQSIPGAGGSSAGWGDAFSKGFGGFDAGNNPLLSAMQLASGDGAKSFEQMGQEWIQQSAPFQNMLKMNFDTPAFGMNREKQEQDQNTKKAFTDYQAALGKYNQIMLKASQRGVNVMESKLAERSEPGRQIESLRGLFDLWIDAAEEGYAEVALSDEFRSVYGELVNAQNRLKQLVQLKVEQSTGGMGMPTRTEINTVHQRMHEMRKQIRDLQTALATAKGSAPLNKGATQTASEPAKAAKPAAAKSAAAKKPAAAAPSKNKTAARKPTKRA